MPHLRTNLGLCGLLLAVFAWGCSGADDEHTSDQSAAAKQVMVSDFQIASPKFTQIRPRKPIPLKNTCYGDSLSPPLAWNGAPEATKSYALIAQDVDHSTGDWVHWVVYNIPAM